MSTSDADVKPVAVVAEEAAPPQEPPVEETTVSVEATAEVATPNGAEEAATGVVADAPKKRGRKRKVSVVDDKVAPPTDDESAPGENATPAAAIADTEVVAEKEKKPPAKKKKAVPAGTPEKGKKKLGRPRKIVQSESETEDETEVELTKRVEALPEEVTAKYGSIVWAKMVSYPYWPAMILDPRRVNDPRLQASALKEIDTKYLVRFYHANNLSFILFKNIEPWDDTKQDYRDGFPTKDAKAPKRRRDLMTAIELADKEISLPIEERMNGIMKIVVKEVAPPKQAEEAAASEPKRPVAPKQADGPKRKLGRPVGSKNKPKADGAAAATPAPVKGKRGRKKKEVAVIQDDEETEEEPERMATQATTPETPEEYADDAAAPALSKEKIEAKVASRKTPSKKKAVAGDDKSAAAASKKAVAKTGKSTGGDASSKTELDSKRKKEIELVVPRKSVKSADIREATEEAARKKIGAREKPKDKGDYKVGNLAQFASKMTRLHANESSKNNDELIQMLAGLFEEKMVFRSDAERSGVAAVIAALRKSSNPTVATTASAVRKHLMKVLNDDMSPAAVPPAAAATATKRTKAEADAEEKPAKKQKTEESSEDAATTPKTEPEPASVVEATSDEPVEKEEATEEATPKESQPDVKKEPAAEPAPVIAEKPSVAPEVTKQEPAKPASPVKSSAPAKPVSPVKTDAPPAVPKADPTGDKGRMTCIDMLKKALAPIGEKSAQIAREVEEQVFDRFNESNEEYRTCARSITFGLKKNAKVRERLQNGSLHALELAYSHEEILKEA